MSSTKFMGGDYSFTPGCPRVRCRRSITTPHAPDFVFMPWHLQDPNRLKALTGKSAERAPICLIWVSRPGLFSFPIPLLMDRALVVSMGGISAQNLGEDKQKPVQKVLLGLFQCGWRNARDFSSVPWCGNGNLRQISVHIRRLAGGR